MSLPAAADAVMPHDPPAGARSWAGGGERRQAILVAHGIGQQYPFQVLDSVSQGLRATLEGQGYSVSLAHLALGVGKPFDHAVRIEATAREGAGLSIDVHEYWWASHTAGKASFLDVVRWLRQTALSPLRRLTYNIPLVRALSSAGVEASGLTTPPRLSYGWQIVREFVRVAVVLMVSLAVATMATWLVVESASAAKTLTAVLAGAARNLVRVQSLADVRVVVLRLAYGLAYLGTMIAFVALVSSLVSQVRELRRLRKLRPDVSKVANTTLLVAPPVALSQRLRGTERRMLQPLATFSRACTAAEELPVLIRSRTTFFRYSVWIALGLFVIVSGLWISGRAPSVLYTFLDTLRGSDPNWWLKLGAPLALIAGASVVKQVFVNYVADVALYATADENSTFFDTRSKILDGATKRIRWLLRQPDYDDVVLAGHSLGSVIMYDALSRLIAESQAPNEIVRASQAALRDIAGRFGAAPETTRREMSLKMRELRLYVSAPTRQFAQVAECESALRQLATVCGCAQNADFDAHFKALRDFVAQERLDTWKSTTPTTPGELVRVSALITFGSPLDKILYFFRTRIQVYESIRAHIINQLFGFRRVALLKAPALEMVDVPPFNPVDSMYWVNVSAACDPVSAELRFYTCDDEVRRPYWLWGACHTWYWHDPQFYAVVWKALQKGHEANARRWSEAVAALPDVP